MIFFKLYIDMITLTSFKKKIDFLLYRKLKKQTIQHYFFFSKRKTRKQFDTSQTEKWNRFISRCFIFTSGFLQIGITAVASIVVNNWCTNTNDVNLWRRYSSLKLVKLSHQSNGLLLLSYSTSNKIFHQ